jgi:hypothetical protein
MELEFIDNEISESRLYRATGNMRNLDGRDVADLVYLNTIALYMMLQDDAQHSYAANYAKQTSQYGGYTAFRTSATDLYMLCHVLSNPNSDKVNLKDSFTSTRFLKRLNFDSRKHYAFMKKIANASDRANDAINYFFRLEAQLNITNSKFKRYRRFITNWGNLKYSSKQLVVTQILQNMRAIGRGSELISPMTTMTKYRKYREEPAYDVPRTSLAQKVAGAAVGAYVGSKAAGKLAQVAKDKPETFKKVGTGIGAIAGYWAAGRRKKQV